MAGLAWAAYGPALVKHMSPDPRGSGVAVAGPICVDMKRGPDRCHARAEPLASPSFEYFPPSTALPVRAALPFFISPSCRLLITAVSQASKQALFPTVRSETGLRAIRSVSRAPYNTSSPPLRPPQSLFPFLPQPVPFVPSAAPPPRLVTDPPSRSPCLRLPRPWSTAIRRSRSLSA